MLQCLCNVLLEQVDKLVGAFVEIGKPLPWHRCHMHPIIYTRHYVDRVLGLFAQMIARRMHTSPRTKLVTLHSTSKYTLNVVSGRNWKSETRKKESFIQGMKKEIIRRSEALV